MQNVCQPLYNEGRNITGRASAAVTGKRFVRISGNSTDGVPAVAHATAAERVWGVSGYDAAEDAILPVIRKGVVPVTAEGALSADDEVEVGTAGKATVLDTGVAVGVVLFDAADGDDVMIALYE
jgi:hypothetical protein